MLKSVPIWDQCCLKPGTYESYAGGKEVRVNVTDLFGHWNSSTGVFSGEYCGVSYVLLAERENVEIFEDE